MRGPAASLLGDITPAQIRCSACKSWTRRIRQHGGRRLLGHNPERAPGVPVRPLGRSGQRCVRGDLHDSCSPVGCLRRGRSRCVSPAASPAIRAQLSAPLRRAPFPAASTVCGIFDDARTGSIWWSPRLLAIPAQPSLTETQPRGLLSGRSMLITGGLGSLGILFAHWAAQQASAVPQWHIVEDAAHSFVQ